ncbi:MAG: cobalamin biosynthesis protein CobQ [Leptolyngbya sp. SIOISBB]|nr:cobalamin biosynthesis protein CobQ [Leptolyngbya sp. SIOISBB]
MVMPLLKRYGLALKRYKWVAVAAFLGTLGISGVLAMQPPPEEEYRTTGVLVQNTPVVSFTATGVELQQQGQGIITQDFLLADILLSRVAEQLNNGGLEITPQQIRNRTNININTGGGEEGGNILQSVNVTYQSGNPQEAEAVLSVLFQGMVELSRVTNRARLGTIIGALEERLPAIEAELREAEQTLEAYDRIEGPAIQAALDGSLLGEISSSQQQRRQNLITLAGIDAQMQSLQAQLGLSPEAAYASSALSADPIVQNLRASIYQAESQIKTLSRDLRPAHPTMVELQNSLETYDQLLQERAVEVIGDRLPAVPSAEVIRQNSNLDPARAQLANQLVGLKTQRDALITQQQVLAQSEQQLRAAYTRLPNKQLERDRLAQQVALKKALYDQVQAKRIDAQAAEAETVSSLSVASPPSTEVIPVEAASPIVVLLLGSIVGLGIGGGLVFLLDMLDPTIRIFEDLDKLFEEQDIPLLGVIPELNPRQAEPLLITDLNHPCSEIYERLRSNLQLSGLAINDGQIPKTVLVTSPVFHEGKTTTAYNLGIASARAGRRTLIVEMNFRSPSQCMRFGIQPDEQAMIEPLQYYSGRLSDPIRMVPGVANLFITPGIGPQRNPTAILDSSEMSRFLKDSKARFDFVILDAPHFTGSNDVVLLEPRTDGMVIVTRPGVTKKPIIKEVLEQLEEKEDIRVLGGVINSADIPITAAQMRDDTLIVDDDDLENANGASSPASAKVPVRAPVEF